MENYREKIVNIQTGEETYRDYSAAEIAEVEAALIEAKARATQAKIREQNRVSALAKLAALGLTEDEIAAL